MNEDFETWYDRPKNRLPLVTNKASLNKRHSLTNFSHGQIKRHGKIKLLEDQVRQGWTKIFSMMYSASCTGKIHESGFLEEGC